MENLLDGLNKEQREAVEYINGPLLVLAGAGSGKTRVLTHRIAYIMQNKNVYPSNILAITFTNKAANEMKSRVHNLIGDIASKVWISTFHAAGVRILRKDAKRLGFTKSFVIFDYQDQQTCVKEVLKELNINEKNFQIREVLEKIGRAKDNLETPEMYMKKYGSDFRLGKIATIYEKYQQKLKNSNALDFDDIIFYTIKLLKENSDILEYYQDKFKYIMIDEYQDTNIAQYTLVSLLAQKNKNLCVVGDDDQSIYGFRGADIRNILDFEKDFKGAKIIKLEQNYRSTCNILNVANEVIKNNYGRKNKKLRTENEEGEKISYYRAGNEHEEARYIANKIKEYVKNKGKKYSDFAVLYRVNAQSRTIEDALMKLSIPYKMVGGLRFYDRKEIKDIIAYLRLIQNPTDDIALKRIINVPRRGIGTTTISKIQEVSTKRECSMFSIVSMASQIEDLRRTCNKLENFARLINELRSSLGMPKVSQFIEFVIDKAGILKGLEEENTIESISRIENIKEFISVAMEYDKREDAEGLEDFLENIALVSDVDNIKDEQDNVVLMTLHSAKGLEYPNVFLVGMEECVFPSSRSLTTEAGIEEERRLCYVGITRAKEKLFITNANRRTLFGNTSYNKVSRFIEEMPQELLDSEVEQNNNSTKNNYFRNNNQKKTLPKYSEYIVNRPIIRDDYECNFSEGDAVFHKKFGNGIISKIQKEKKDYKLEIIFEDAGIKRMMAAYSNLEHIN